MIINELNYLGMLVYSFNISLVLIISVSVGTKRLIGTNEVLVVRY